MTKLTLRYIKGDRANQIQTRREAQDWCMTPLLAHQGDRTDLQAPYTG